MMIVTLSAQGAFFFHKLQKNAVFELHVECASRCFCFRCMASEYPILDIEEVQLHLFELRNEFLSDVRRIATRICARSMNSMTRGSG